MSEIEKLIKEKCPNGVEYYELGKIATFSQGIQMALDKQHYEKESGDIRFLRITDYTNTNEPPRYIKRPDDKYIKKKNDLIMIRYGTPGKVCIDYEGAIANNMFKINFNKENISNKYMYYYLSQNKIYNTLSTSVKSTMPAINFGLVSKIRVPVPPLEVQCEIVHILDDFTLLSAELSAEMKARQKQYDYYSEKLLNNIETKEISFGDACDVVTDYVAAGSFGDIAKNVQYINTPDYAQLIRTVDIKNNFEKADYIYVSENAFKYLWRVNLDKECVILPNIGVNCGEVYYITPKILKYKNNVLGPNAILVRSEKNNNKFLSYIFKTRDFQKQLRKIISPAGQTKFNKTELKKIILHIPERKVQDELVKKLEKLDKLCNDISEGLPAEIEARQKQYEYYRDKLLTFKELKINE